ncbi:MAG: Wzz/FepE/Etk N-terminal domain-containing protein [Gammaproteobacteria bacterium]
MSKQAETGQRPGAEPRPPAPYYYEDEISLIDLWLVLVKRKNLLFAVLAVFALAGLTMALVVPKQYNYTTSIEIGSRIVRDDVQPIERPETVLAKIQESYIPLVQHQYRKQNPEHSGNYSINARIPKGSQIIVLESKGSEQIGDIYKNLQQNVVNKVQQDHQRILEVIRKELEIKRNEAVNKLEDLKDNGNLLVSQESRLTGLAQLLKDQIKGAKNDLKLAEKNRRRAVSEATNATKAMTLLMLDNEVQQQRERLAKLEERLMVDVAEGQDRLANEIADNTRQQQTQKDKIARIEAQQANLVETRALVPPMQSTEPKGLGKKMILVLALVLGFIVAVFTAFFAEFLQKARQQVQDDTDTSDATPNA